MPLVVHAFGKTNVGRVRAHNEDSYFAGRTVFAVADGMGGHAAGEVASEAALGPIRQLDGSSYDQPDLATDALSQAVSDANGVVLDKAAADPELRGMGTTLTTVLIRQHQLHLAHVGDSRAYLLRDDTLELLTEDHTLVNQLVKEGRITEEQAAVHPQRSVITRAIGVESRMLVDTMADPLVLQPGDQILLCSDGLTGPVSEPEIAEILASEADGDVACQRLIDAANAGGGPDNITAVLLRVEGDAPPAPATPVAKAGRGDDDSTAELGDPATLQELADADTTPSQGLDVQRLKELNDGPPDLDSPPPELRGTSGRRRVAIVFGVLLVLFFVIAGGFLLLSRQFFIGADDDGGIAIFRGQPSTVLGIDLATEVLDVDLKLGDLPVTFHDDIEEGRITFNSRADAEAYVTDTLTEAAAGLTDEVEPGDEEGQPATAAPAASSELTPSEATPSDDAKAEPSPIATE